MAMMISKFHRLIQSRLLWMVFLVVIVFSFVIWGMAWPSSADREREANAAGEINGEYISQQDFRHAYFNVYMSVVLMMGRPLDINEKVDRQLRTAAWQRLVALREAGKMGLTADDQEVVASIQQNQGFADQGRFNPARYKAFVQNMLEPAGFAEPQFEQHIREEIVLQKLRYVIQQMAMVSPLELKRTFDVLMDTFDIQYTVVSATNVEAKVQVTEEDARKFFLQDPAAFTLPEKAKIKYIALVVSNYLAEVEVTEEEALDFYNENIEEYTRMVEVTNVDSVATNLEPVVQSQKVTTPYEEVQTNIMEQLRYVMARSKAADVATEFVVALQPDQDGKTVDFETEAAARGFAVATLPPFSQTELVEAVDAGPAFNRAAFRLEKTPEECISDAIPGKHHVYVMALEEKIAARVPEFEEAREDILAAARRQAVGEALSKLAAEVREAAVKALAEGREFSQAVEKFKLPVEKTGAFTVAEGIGTNELAQTLMRGIVTYNQGEITELLPTSDAIALAYIAVRQPGDPASFDSFRQQIAESIHRQRGQNLFNAWQESMLRGAGFRDLNARAPAEEDEADEEEESDSEE